MSVEEDARALYRQVIGGEPDILVRSPGRVNLIGDHTDYNDGLALPLAIDRELWVAARAAPGGVELTSAEAGNLVRVPLDCTGDRRDPPRLDGWGRYVEGVTWALTRAGLPLNGFRGVIMSDIPDGAGLSSSAALELGIARTFAAVSGFDWDPVAMAKVCQRAENEWVGVASGLLDQLACAKARRGQALRIDFRSLDLAYVDLPDSLRIVVLDTTTRRELRTSSYNDRRRECQEAVAAFGVDTLRELTTDRLERSDAVADVLTRRARHVVSENARVAATVTALAAGDVDRVGRILAQSHASLRDDFESSSAALDAIVEAAGASPGCHGARVTGGGFAGCAVALVEEGEVEAFVREVGRRFRDATGLDAVLHPCRATAGTERVA
jgi:galactokinase